MDHGPRAHRRTRLSSATLLAVAVAVSACSAPSSGGGDSAPGGSGGGEGLPDVIQIMNIRALTGPVSFAGIRGQQGIDLALKEIEADGLLGDSTLELDTRDVASDTQQAASVASEAIADPAYAAVLGPEASAQSTALSPILQSAGMPVVYVQSGSDGVVTGDYTFRTSPPAPSYFPIVEPWLESEGFTSGAVIINTANPTLVELGQNTVPGIAEDIGMDLTSSSGVEGTAADFTSQATQIAADDPDVVFLMLTGPQYPVAVTQLRQAGWDGQFVGMTAMGSGNLTPAGPDADGAVWPTGFTAEQTGDSSEAFVAAFEDEYGEAPTNYSAEAYDALWFLARGLAEADSTDRAALQQGLATVAAAGFDGAQGAITFDGNDARVPGILVTWDGTQEVPLEDGGA